VQQFHTGAALNGVVAVSKETATYLPQFRFSPEGNLTWTTSATSTPDYPYQIYLAPALYHGSTAPSSLGSVQLNIGPGTSGVFKTPNGVIAQRKGGETVLPKWLVCEVTTVSDNDRVGPVKQLLWNKGSGEAVLAAGFNCATVDLVAVSE